MRGKRRGVAWVAYWLPRALGVLLTGVVALFAVDVFGAGYTFWGTVTAFLIHLAPAWVLLMVLAVAWRWEWAGGVAYLALAALFAGAARAPVLASLFIVAPLASTGALFLLDWALRSRDGAAGGGGEEP